MAVKIPVFGPNYTLAWKVSSMLEILACIGIILRYTDILLNIPIFLLLYIGMAKSERKLKKSSTILSTFWGFFVENPY